MRNGSRVLSPGTLVGVAALVLALAGTSIAATELGKNSVGATELGKVKLRSAEDAMSGFDPPENRAVASVECKKKEQLLGGGATIPDVDPLSTDPPSVEQNGPVDKRTWYAVGHTDNQEVTLRVTALCLKK
jgi:hypothetical protein